MNATRRKDWIPTKSSFLCGEHFEKSCFVVWPSKTAHRISPGAVPSIFPAFTEHLQQPASNRKSSTKGKQLHAEHQSESSPSKL